ncbi:amidohydrolase [Balneolales bacterium ANBcel1]|nr:amidohydrolase [Balneolales bacterium ANBcel1]
MNRKKQISPAVESLSGRIDEIFEDVVGWRRHMHRNPELSFQEFETTDWIIEKLESWGYRVHRPCETGCVAELAGGRPGKVTALRADIDALPIQEEGDAKAEFASEKPGVAHCCGHDIHTSNLLGTARLLSEFREQVAGKVVLVFQAGEEVLPGGGRLLMETGILNELGVEQVYGLHTYPALEPGRIGTKEGPLMASPFEFKIEVRGKGGHAAAPHQAVDPIVIAAQIIMQLQTIVSRNIDPSDATVVTVGKFHAGTAPNIIPEKAWLEGTIRTFDEKQTRFIFDRITTIAEKTAEAMGGDAKSQLIIGYPPVINDAAATHRLQEAAGEALITLEKPVMAGEDFSFYQKQIPGAFFFLGSGSEEADSRYPWHHPKYNVDERCLKTGMKVMTNLVLQS